MQLVATSGALWMSLPIAALVFAIGAALTRLGVIGGGDAKLIAAVTVLVPPIVVPALLVCIAHLGRHIERDLSGRRLVRAAERRSDACRRLSRIPAVAHFDQIVRIEVARMRASEPMPYGVAIFGGVAGLLLIGVLSCISATSCSL